MILAAALAALTTIAPGPASGLSAYGGKVVWEQKQADGTYRLVADDGRTVANVPVPASRKPFGADLGPGRAGGVAAVYQRCAGTCRAYRFDFTSGRETRIHPPVPAGCRTEALSIWRDELAATASHCRRAAVYVRVGAHTRRLAAAPRHAPILYDVEAGPRRVAWFSTLAGGFGPNERVRFADLRRGGQTRTVFATGPSGDSIQDLESLAFDSSRLSWYWSTVCDGCDPPSHVVAVDATDGRHEKVAPLADDPAHGGRSANSIAVTATDVLFSDGFDVLAQPRP